MTGEVMTSNTGPDKLVHHIVQKAYDLWDDLRWLPGDRSRWRWVLTPEMHQALADHQWNRPEPDDERYPPGYTGPVRQTPDRSEWTLFGIPIVDATEPMNHNQIELRILR